MSAEEQFVRSSMLLGEDTIVSLHTKRVAVFGVGGVGGFVCEALVRSGIGAFDLIDDDRVAVSNLNRQIVALHSTIGQYKVDVMKARMLDINPNAQVNVYPCFFLPENADQFPFERYDYVVDAIDTVTAKIELILRCKEAGVPIISAMGAGNKLDPSAFVVTDIYKTEGCPLARVMRRELKKRGVESLKVVFSKEKAMTPIVPISKNEDEKANGRGTQELACEMTQDVTKAGDVVHAKRQTPGSVAFVPAAAGLVLAGEVIRDLAGIR